MRLFVFSQKSVQTRREYHCWNESPQLTLRRENPLLAKEPNGAET
jgi:hypothetical protein